MHVKADVRIQNFGPPSDVSLALWYLCVGCVIVNVRLLSFI